uniref:Uncharacterized protein n=1 Tax=Phlebotomus papatasi TaxID=29031 RepID=A0A1B0DJC3_PHLPP
MDIVGLLTETGNKYIVTMYDELTKYLVAEPIKDQTSRTVPEALVDRFIYIFGAPIQICSDQGGCFVSATFRQKLVWHISYELRNIHFAFRYKILITVKDFILYFVIFASLFQSLGLREHCGIRRVFD